MKHFTVFAEDKFATEPCGGMGYTTNCVGQKIFMDRPARLVEVHEVVAHLVAHYRCVSVFVGKSFGKLFWINYGAHKTPFPAHFRLL